MATASMNRFKWTVRRKDNEMTGYTGTCILDGYKLTGPSYGASILERTSARRPLHPILVYDFDGDGMAEVAMKTAPHKDGLNNSLKPACGRGGQYRRLPEFCRQNAWKVTTGPEWYTVSTARRARTRYRPL